MEQNNQITETEFLLSCFGRNEEGEANAEVSCTLLEYIGDDDPESQSEELNYREISTRFSKEGEFSLESHKGIVQVSLAFTSNLNPAFRLFWQQLEDYGKRLNQCEFDPEYNAVPLLSFVVAPDKYATEYYLSLSNPMLWFMQPANPTDEDCKVIRMFFSSKNITMQEVPEEVDIRAAQASITRPYEVIYTENPSN